MEIRIDKRILDTDLYRRKNVFRLFIHLLLSADGRGEIKTTWKTLCKATGLTMQECRTAMGYCVTNTICNTISNTKNPREGMLVIICDCADYVFKNKESNEDGQHNLQHCYQHNEEEREKNQKRIEEDKKKKESNNTKVLLQKKEKKLAIEIKRRYAPEVLLTDGEYAHLCERFGEQGARWMIQKLDDYKAARGMTYKSDYRAILNWVVKEFNKQHDTESRMRIAEREKCERDRAFAEFIAEEYGGAL